MAKTIYLANPYGFSQQEKVTLLPPIIAALESLALVLNQVWKGRDRGDAIWIGHLEC